MQQRINLTQDNLEQKKPHTKSIVCITLNIYLKIEKQGKLTLC